MAAIEGRITSDEGYDTSGKGGGDDKGRAATLLCVVEEGSSGNHVDAVEGWRWQRGAEEEVRLEQALLKSRSGDATAAEVVVMVAIRCRHRQWVAEGGNDRGSVGVGMMVTTSSLLRRRRMAAKEMVGGGMGCRRSMRW
ncbi:hypothetical protein BHM03_00046902 [Ensete ventricosum]|nr:hypothetical protein BHM03_00046902 [Ensete ventricosum]